MLLVLFYVRYFAASGSLEGRARDLVEAFARERLAGGGTDGPGRDERS